MNMNAIVHMSCTSLDKATLRFMWENIRIQNPLQPPLTRGIFTAWTGSADTSSMESTVPITSPPPRPEGSGGRAPGYAPWWRGRALASVIGLLLVLLGVGGLALWSSQSNARAARLAVSASVLSKDYEQISNALAAEESLEREYRLRPGPEVRALFDQESAQLLASVKLLQQHGQAQDRAIADQILLTHAEYLRSQLALLAAVDRGDAREALRIDDSEVDPRFSAIEAIVDQADSSQHQSAALAVANLQTMESSTARATPVVFALGLVLIGLFSSVLRGVQRQLDAHRKEAVHASLHDSLTGLPNRSLLEDRLGQALRAGRRTRSATGVLMLDLDRFKEVNDTLGHHVGDWLLAQVGHRFTEVLREVDTVARLAGDEFAVVLPGIDGVNGALVVTQKLRDALAQPFDVEDVALEVEASIGVAVSGEHGEDFSTLLRRADVAMYVAKNQNLGVSVYDSENDEHSRDSLALLGQLRQGLQSSELVLHYQPKVNLTTGEACGVEALVRWQHPTRGLIPPDQFIPLAEHTGLIGPLTHYVLDTTLAQVRTWTDAGYPIPVSVNLSARNLLDRRLPDQVAALLTKHRVPAGMLVLEVTESAIMSDPIRAERLLKQLQVLGVGIAIDDFGVGYTSLGRLKTLPVNELKIDCSFVTSMETDPDNVLIVQSMVNIGHNLGLAVVAEGVETEEVVAALGELGCDIAQGYHYCRPLPADDLLSWYVQFAAANTYGDAGPALAWSPGWHGTRTG